LGYSRRRPRAGASRREKLRGFARFTPEKGRKRVEEKENAVSSTKKSV